MAIRSEDISVLRTGIITTQDTRVAPTQEICYQPAQDGYYEDIPHNVMVM